MAASYIDERYIANEIKEYEKSPKFVAEGLALKVAEEVSRLLQEKGLNQSDLAMAMGVSRSLVSSILNAPPNMTFLTFARLSLALGVTPDVTMTHDSKSVRAVAQPSKYEDQIITTSEGFSRLSRTAIATREVAYGTAYST